jgi:hypothetical protein
MSVNKVKLSTGETLIDLTGDSVAPETLAKGETAHDASGNKIVGTLDPRCKSYEITLAKSSGWVLLTTLDDEVLEHINDTSLIVSLNRQDDYEYSYYSGSMYIVGNKSVGYSGTYPVYGIANRLSTETAMMANSIFYPANKTDTGISLGGIGMFRLDGNKYYLRPGDGYISQGAYRLTFTW